MPPRTMTKNKKNLLDLAKSFKDAHDVWVEAGKPIRSPEEMKRIHDICKLCPLFLAGQGFLPGYDKCGECGCNLHESFVSFNKLAYGTTQCPLDEPKW